MMNVLLCTALWMAHAPTTIPAERAVTCARVLDRAAELGVDTNLALAVAWHESRFNAQARSKVGALGPIQVMPRWHCPGRRAKGCDLVTAGLKLLKRLEAKYGRFKGLAVYNAGPRRWKLGRRYARKVMKTAQVSFQAQRLLPSL